MYPELFLYVENVRARELRAEAERHRRAGPSSVVRTWETRLGWALVETGLRLVYRTARTTAN
ncbi:hypothetical protein GCM10022419_064110 [Nonomuraea rosea]|uniref:Uncharacterized protein n=1 Tax=Nonomuraea rosea TaxID=638574 RepID=A0ABP6XXL2_9ACTN